MVVRKFGIMGIVASIWSMCLLTLSCFADEFVSVIDDDAKEIRLGKPASRIISLSPHATELLFSAGAGDKIIGVIEYSNYPEAAKKIKRIGDYFAINEELILSLKPDLIVAWKSGIKAELLYRLKQYGFPVFLSEPDNFDKIASNVSRLAKLAATEVVGDQAVNTFREEVAQLRKKHQSKKRIRGFYQVWHDPLQTLNGKHFASRAMDICGVDNVFGDQQLIAPLVNEESVINADPHLILSGGSSENALSQLQTFWRPWQIMTVNKYEHFFIINSDWVARPTFRLLKASRQICEAADKVRARLINRVDSK